MNLLKWSLISWKIKEVKHTKSEISVTSKLSSITLMICKVKHKSNINENKLCIYYCWTTLFSIRFKYIVVDKKRLLKTLL